MINDGTVGVIGHFNSSCSIPASDVYNRAGIPMITPGSTNPQLTEKGYRGVFRVCGRDDQQGKIGANFVSIT
jgi:branched-chain amino acid transport system substrate-binding protein